jgi:dCMP deaminase
MLQSYKWHIRYLKLARLVASWSKDPSTKCGAVIVNANNQIVSTGFNGFPQGIQDNEDLLIDRNTKLMMTIHAEVNAILFARQPLDGCTIYTWPMHACSQCAATIIQSGISHHVTIDNPNKRWEASHKIAEVMFNEAKLDVHLYDPKELEDEHETK